MFSLKQAWWLIGVAGRIIIVLFIALVCAALSLPFFASLPIEFVGVSGEQAESRIRAYWAEDVDSRDIEKASGKIYSQIDCYAGWYQITLRPEAAEKWQKAIHLKLETSARIGRGVEFIEGVHRTVTGPIVTEPSFGKAPKWWIPSSFDFRGTERMRWYSGGTTYADALYSGFDPATNTLWIYDYSQQHGQLWSRGSVPAGERFVLGSSKNHGELETEIKRGDADKRD